MADSLCFLKRYRRLAVLIFLIHFHAFAVTVEVSDSPSNNLALILDTISSAKKTLVINAYEFTSPEIAAALIKKIREGIKVEILLEGQPLGGMSDKGTQIQQSLVNSMNDSPQAHRFYLMSSEASENTKRRFRYNHAKYFIVDGEKVLLGSENYSSTGHPLPGKKGTRGWETLIHSKTLVQQFSSLFKQDSSREFGDVIEETNSKWRNPLNRFEIKTWVTAMESFRTDLAFPTSPKAFDARAIDTISSPDSSLNGLLQMINNSTKTLELELMTFASKWGNTGKESPLFRSILSAARRGVQVRVLLNDEYAFVTGGNGDEASRETKKTNIVTQETFNKYGEEEGISLEARIAKTKAMGVQYIHNKGALSDGNRTLISSINWNRNSVENNRETAVIINGTQVFDYYHTLFEHDWAVSE